MAKKPYNVPHEVDDQKTDDKTTTERVNDLALQYNLDKRDQDILKLVIGYPGIKPKQIADILKIHVHQVIYRLKKPAYEKAIADYNAPTAKLVEDMTRKATRRLMELMDSSDPKMRVRACEVALKHLNQYHMHISNTLAVAVKTEGATPQETVGIYANIVRDDGELIKKMIQIQVSEWNQVQSGEKTMDQIKRERGLLTSKDIEVMEGLKNAKPFMDEVVNGSGESGDREA